jgi:hypothetical protein
MTARGYSGRPMSRMQFLMLRAIEGGASLNEATEAALAWDAQHPDSDLFEERPYAQWRTLRDDQSAPAVQSE